MKQLLSRSFQRYAVVGLSAAITEYSSFYIFFILLGVHLNIANGISFCFALCTSFSLNRLWTFKHKERQYHIHVTKQFIFYTLLALANLILTILLVDYLKFLGIDPRIGKLIAMLFTSLWNFFIFQRAIFKPKLKLTD